MKLLRLSFTMVTAGWDQFHSDQEWMFESCDVVWCICLFVLTSPAFRIASCLDKLWKMCVFWNQNSGFFLDLKKKKKLQNYKLWCSLKSENWWANMYYPYVVMRTNWKRLENCQVERCQSAGCKLIKLLQFSNFIDIGFWPFVYFSMNFHAANKAKTKLFHEPVAWFIKPPETCGSVPMKFVLADSLFLIYDQ